MSAPLVPVQVPINGHLPRAVRQSRLPANDKGDNEMIPGVVHISPSNYLTTEETPIKLQLGDHSMKAVQLFTASNGVPRLQITSIGSYSTSGSEKERIRR